MQFETCPPITSDDGGNDTANDLILHRTPVEYRHTVAELEDEVNRVMIEGCKVDACLDLFLFRVLCYIPEAEKSARFGQWRYYFTTAIDMVPDEKRNNLTMELQKNLNRLLPGYLGDGVDDILTHAKIKDRLQNRWQMMKKDGRDVEDEGKDKISKSLVDILMEKQYNQRAGLAEAPSSNDQASFVESCRKLRSLIEDERASASFSCGGTIHITSSTHTGTEKKDLTSSPPVSIFWNKGYDAAAHKLVLPTDISLPGASPETLQQLVSDCDPASFGRGEQDVIDPEYRRAGKLNADQFATSFHPADFGILDNVGQVLLQSISTETDNQLQFRRIKAELYKLNVYSGPSGLFRKHVDTPRAANQIGSLVVCLPSKFTGGSLSVEHHGQKVNFDWSEKSNTVIQWAAFYSDCEHEIETITSGNRITLTYNLYVTEPIGGVIPSPTATVDPRTLSMYGWMRNLLIDEEFMKEGGVLGFFCSHAYAHSSKLAHAQLPRGLKGADLVLYSVLKSLGVDVDILPILESNGHYGKGNAALEITGKPQQHRQSYMDRYDWDRGELCGYLEHGGKALDLAYTEVLPNPRRLNEYEDIDRCWKLLMMARKVKGMEDALQGARANGLPVNEESFYKSPGVQVGISRHPYQTHDEGYEADLDEVVQDVWPAYYLPGITWITEPKHEEMAFSQIAYGNEASIGTRYSCAALLAVIPPSAQRCGILRQG
ncbi:2OG-Fe(II) oxygenase [Aspergillus lucknowensis]|uniref:Fe2OG dioxygenase domain-containing protein n=1 Tax=Aspergillus lucknowensis TaxID=176173 RepID=A0ABR4LNI3_9EURO